MLLKLIGSTLQIPLTWLSAQFEHWSSKTVKSEMFTLILALLQKLFKNINFSYLAAHLLLPCHYHHSQWLCHLEHPCLLWFRYLD